VITETEMLDLIAGFVEDYDAEFEAGRVTGLPEAHACLTAIRRALKPRRRQTKVVVTWGPGEDVWWDNHPACRVQLRDSQGNWAQTLELQETIELIKRELPPDVTNVAPE